MSLGWSPVNGSFAVAVFVFVFVFVSLEFVSLLLPPCWWAGMVGEGVGVASSSLLSEKKRSCWLLAARVCWFTDLVEELTCLFSVWRLT